eukprot:6312798-Prymnesium_polylepis.1
MGCASSGLVMAPRRSRWSTLRRRRHVTAAPTSRYRAIFERTDPACLEAIARRRHRQAHDECGRSVDGS